MKGVSFVMDDNNRKIAVQIDMGVLKENQDEIEDLLDSIIAESRADDDDVSWSDAKEELRKAGKL